MKWPRIFLAFSSLFFAITALAGAPLNLAPGKNGPATGLADSAALRATVFGTAPQDMAPLPETVPLAEINISLPWKQPVPEVFWFDRRLRVWFSCLLYTSPSPRDRQKSR